MSNTTLGIDVGKFELAIALRKDGKFTDKLVENNSKGFQKILKFLEKNAPEAEVYLEATGRYDEKVTDFLPRRGFDVKVTNPTQIRDFARTKLSRHKRENYRRVWINFRRKNLHANQRQRPRVEGIV